MLVCVVLRRIYFARLIPREEYLVNFTSQGILGGFAVDFLQGFKLTR
jgi:hypothetical protein